MNDFKTKYFEKASMESEKLMNKGLIVFDVYSDLFPLINEMREALEFYKEEEMYLMTCSSYTDNEMFKKIALEKRQKEGKTANQALKNLDDFVGGGE